MSTAPNRSLTDLADRLYRWRGRELLGATDVYAWVRRPNADWGRYGVAFVGDALKMTRHALLRNLPNAGGSLDLSLQRALSLPAETRRDAGGRPHPAHQTMSTGEVHLSEVLDGVEQLADEVLATESMVEATLMPSEGAPWSVANDPTPYYSAKQRKVRTNARPDWVVPVETADGAALGADFCAFAPRIDHCDAGAVVGRFGRDSEAAFLVTHASAVFDRYGGASPEETAALIRSCGGLLFPSLAVSEQPATNYGELVLVADVSLILPAMRPYRRRGTWPVVVYDTDVWTETTRAFMGSASAELLTELTDIPNYMYKQHFWVLGPPVMDREVPPLDSTRRLRTSLAKRARVYGRDMDEAQLEQARIEHFDDVAKYPYLEAKVNGITDMSCYPLAVCPTTERRRSEEFLEAIGFEGDLITVPRPKKRAGRDQRWDLAWRMRDAILGYAAQRPAAGVMTIQE